jgi:hypothetical protein
MYLNEAPVEEEPVTEPLKEEELGLPEGFAVEPTPTGFLRLVTPSGAVVELSPEEERAIAKEVLMENMRLQMTAWRRTKDAIISSAVGAAGYAVGIGLAGVIVAGVLRWLGAKEAEHPRH